MKSNNIFAAADLNYPNEEEMRSAQLACCGRVCKRCETPAAYAWRKREVDMAVLLEKAIENELTPNEKDIVKNRWYNSMSFSEIARNRGITPAAVKSTADRALNKLERVLQYVIFYQRDVVNETIVPAVAGQAAVIAAARNLNPDGICRRLYALRVANGYSLRSLSAATGISRKRLSEIEAGDLPEIEEVIYFSGFFAVTADYILKGENDV